ncbi:helix-turn-helix transcriptional regulator [Streptomyces longispororuber]|uniref:helix-turn-helix transcriptional regulator n=1 Tax=Streptomyces longispororuber TaxID=68230 RepID=UPI00210E1362|nr:LuxR family transcriptional regulator [Streptomyces longispororuber]MCQ4212035.1 LuxR C-terminal-related transcriptional regulator [Streptomyces longispororuber]
MVQPHPHGTAELCDAGMQLYARALREGRVPREDTEPTPCLESSGLLRPDAEDPQWLHPVPPAVALPGLLKSIEDNIARERVQGASLASAFAPLMSLDAERASVPDAPMITVLLGFQRINDAIAEAISASSAELLTIQPGGHRPAPLLASALPREQELLTRGCRMRTLYQHTSRHSPAVLGHYEQLDGDVQVRTLDEVTERLIMLDRTVAFIPANQDRTVALEIRHPALITYLATTFERLWRLATPMFPQDGGPELTTGGVTTRQRTIATLLIEGHTDAVIAERLGMNIRTVRVHIAKLAATLGSDSRAQLGYLIGQSGILTSQD